MGHNNGETQRGQNTIKSKHGHDTTLYCSVLGELSADRKLGYRAVDRRQARQNRSNVVLFHGRVCVGICVGVGIISCSCVCCF